jgi:hypothetical protein
MIIILLIEERATGEPPALHIALLAVLKHKNCWCFLQTMRILEDPILKYCLEGSVANPHWFS